MTQLADAPAAPQSSNKAASPMKTDPKQAHLDNYAGFAPSAPGPKWLAELRERAIRTFEQGGFPGPKHEAWR